MSLRTIGTLALAASFLAPLAVHASPAPQDEHRDQDRDRDQNRDRRYYDREHRDYHAWNDQENSAYRRWAADNHYDNRDYNRLTPEQQRAYWNWRHDHPDAH